MPKGVLILLLGAGLVGSGPVSVNANGLLDFTLGEPLTDSQKAVLSYDSEESMYLENCQPVVRVSVRSGMHARRHHGGL